jgi:sialic acid synthase SpsE
MTPATWKDMVQRTRELELSLGQTIKEVADNELETVVIQRRCIRAARDLAAGTVLTREMLDVLRPAPAGSIAPYDLERVVGKKLLAPMPLGEHLRWPFLGG